VSVSVCVLVFIIHTHACIWYDLLIVLLSTGITTQSIQSTHSCSSHTTTADDISSSFSGSSSSSSSRSCGSSSSSTVPVMQLSAMAMNQTTVVTATVIHRPTQQSPGSPPIEKFSNYFS
jgi:cytoskeletal protein RodZ